MTLEDSLVDSQGGPIAIDAIRVTDRRITVYNLRVADFHTYFVGGKLWQFDAWVHNAGDIYDPSGIAPVSASVAELGLSKATARQRLNSALGSVVGDGKAGHHLLPLEAISDSRTASIVESAARGGFSMNGANNGVLLSQLFHRGGHPKAIERMIRKVSTLSGTDSEVASNLQAILDSERSFLQRIESSRLAATPAVRGRIFLK